MNDATAGPRTVPQILDGALRLYFGRFGLLFGIAAASGVISWLLAQTGPRVQLPMPTPALRSLRVFIPFASSVVVPTWWGSLISFVVAMLAAVAIIVAADAAAEFQDEPVGLSELLGAALRRWWPFIVTAFVFGLVTGLGVILLIVPGLFFGTRWSVAEVAAVVEERGAGSALGRSYDLVRGLFWHAFGAVFLSYLATGIIAFVLRLPVVISLFGGGFGFALASLWGTAVLAATTPYPYCVLVLLLMDLRARKEGTDITYGGA